MFILLIFMGHPTDNNEVTVWMKECGLLMRFQSHLGGTRITTDLQWEKVGKVSKSSWQSNKLTREVTGSFYSLVRKGGGDLSSMLLYSGKEDHKWRV